MAACGSDWTHWPTRLAMAPFRVSASWIVVMKPVASCSEFCAQLPATADITWLRALPGGNWLAQAAAALGSDCAQLPATELSMAFIVPPGGWDWRKAAVAAGSDCDQREVMLLR